MKVQKNNKAAILMIAVLMALVSILAAVHGAFRQEVPEGSLAINYQGDTCLVNIEKLATEKVTGTLVNGKGETKEIHVQAIAMADVLAEANIDAMTVETVTVTADDEFLADVAGDEVRESGKVYMAVEDEGAALIVFGDTNAKRNVRKVVKLDVQ